ncbi:hypothetical protein NUSPORA_00737 [Nucleospora cyclopteri]
MVLFITFFLFHLIVLLSLIPSNFGCIKSLLPYKLLLFVNSTQLLFFLKFYFSPLRMPVKRQNHGRQKKNRGSVNNIQCVQCGRVSPKDKSVSRSSNTPLVEAASMEDLNSHTIYKEPEVPTFFNIDNYCISCACHLRIVRVRAEVHRKERLVGKKKSVSMK